MKKEEKKDQQKRMNGFKSHPSKAAKPLQTKKGVHKWECQYCDLTWNDKSKLNRHIGRKHKEDQIQVNDSSTDVGSGGKCTCTQCGYSCHRIVEFRKHLSKAHNVIYSEPKISSYKTTKVCNIHYFFQPKLCDAFTVFFQEKCLPIYKRHQNKFPSALFSRHFKVLIIYNHFCG